MKVPEKVTVRLGDLRPLLEQHCNKTGKTPSKVIQEALAKTLKTKPPEMISGGSGHKIRRKSASKIS